MPRVWVTGLVGVPWALAGGCQGLVALFLFSRVKEKEETGKGLVGLVLLPIGPEVEGEEGLEWLLGHQQVLEVARW